MIITLQQSAEAVPDFEINHLTVWLQLYGYFVFTNDTQSIDHSFYHLYLKFSKYRIVESYTFFDAIWAVCWIHSVF